MNDLVVTNEKQALEVCSPGIHGNMTPMQMVAMAVSQGVGIDHISKLMDLQERMQKSEAQQAYNSAFAAFNDDSIRILRGAAVTAGPLNGTRYAKLHDIVNAVTPALSKNGLSASWKLTKDDKDWIEVTCTVKHSLGHSESVSMGGPPDSGGAKNAIQARASTVTYLEKYTLKAILGVSEQDDDDDGKGGNGMADSELADHMAAMDAAGTIAELQAAFTAAYKAAESINDKPTMSAIIRAKDVRKKSLAGKEKP